MKRVVIWDLDDSLFDTTSLNGSYEKLDSIKPFDGSKKILSLPNVTNILVTAGDFLIQNKKIDILDVRAHFEKIFICSANDGKLAIFRRLARKFETQVSDIFAIGNRIDCEIRYGNECGFRTIHIAHGHYNTLRPKSMMEIPAHRVDRLCEILPILS